MAINTQFPIAVHILAALGYGGCKNATSEKLAMSVNTSCTFLRRILAKLSKAGLVAASRGKNGTCCLAKNPTRISLLDIYLAVNAPKAFSIHTYKEQKPCPVSCHIKEALQKALERTQKSMEDSLSKISLADIVSEIGKK
jgi:Rrf2 family protein